VRIVCGMTAGAADSKISNQPVTFESNRRHPIRIFAGPYYKRKAMKEPVVRMSDIYTPSLP